MDNMGEIKEGDIFEGNDCRYIVLWKNSDKTCEVAKCTNHDMTQSVISFDELYKKRFIKNVMEL